MKSKQYRSARRKKAERSNTDSRGGEGSKEKEKESETNGLLDRWRESGKQKENWEGAERLERICPRVEWDC